MCMSLLLVKEERKGEREGRIGRERERERERERVGLVSVRVCVCFGLCVQQEWVSYLLLLRRFSNISEF